MSETTSTQLHSWSDAPKPGRSADDWPYPNRYSTSLITGELAALIRKRLGQAEDAPVVITERIESGGYSEYTQENDYYHTITVGGMTVDLGSSWSGNGIRHLTEWLDATEES